MSHGTIREDKTCLNCGYRVDILYCPHCGQQNTVTRQPFYYLITHFVEDFVHYDGSFWSTIKRLLLQPGKLTVDYLAGKRNSQVNPVKMYIFISFVTFFLLIFLPNSGPIADVDKQQSMPLATEQMDEQLKELKEELPAFIYIFVEKYRSMQAKGMDSHEITDAFLQKILSYAPKLLFIYLPVFAFILWLLYEKKSWWYFDHGIFTLHYFSLLLLGCFVISALSLLQNILPINQTISQGIDYLMLLLLWYMVGYLFVALYRVYRQSKRKVVVKGLLILFINSILLALVISAVGAMSFLQLK